MGLTSGQAAVAAGVTRKALRVYEAKGLLAPARHGSGRYRHYTTDDIDTLAFIRRARALGLSLDEIGEIVAIRRGGGRPCSRTRRLLDDRIHEIDATIAELTTLRATLAAASGSALKGRQGSICPVIEQAT